MSSDEASDYQQQLEQLNQQVVRLYQQGRYPEAVESFLELSLTDEEKRKILWDNCARFYAVGEPAGGR